jgi:hypothetical protein
MDLFSTILPDFLLSIVLIIAPLAFTLFIINETSNKYDYYTNTVMKTELPFEVGVFLIFISIFYYFIVIIFVGNYISSIIKDTFTLKWITLKGEIKKEIISELRLRHSQNVQYIVVQNEYLKVDLETFNELKEGDICEADCFLYSKKVIFIKTN